VVICLQYEAHNKKDWDAFIAASKTPLFFFQRDFIEYHKERFIDASFVFYENDKVIAVLPASRHADELVSHGGLTYGGLIVAPTTRISAISEIFTALIESARSQGFKKIIYKAIPHIFHKHSAQEDIYLLFNSLNGRIFRRDVSSVIYLEDRLKLSKGRKWLIARAKKSNLSIKDSDDWDAFHALLRAVLAKHDSVPVHSASELRYLKGLFPENITLKIAEASGRLQAAVLLFRFNKVMHTQYIAVSEEGKESGALDYLIETCIQEGQESGFDYFNFGISTENQGRILNSGLIAQKESFGARGLAIDFYEINLQ
jgi:hypothetical protein